ncbi:MAG: hypothetical protein S4CHLAM20_02900 [Chlamydiia bacterium]|nr:hypothetical protein [Chlamydiia bacterium]
MICFLFSTYLLAAPSMGGSPAEIAIAQHERMHEVRMHSTISEVSSGGRIITLQNGTQWTVYPEDVPYTSGWLGPAPVEITKGPHPDAQYPFLMKNKWTRKIVSVQRLT